MVSAAIDALTPEDEEEAAVISQAKRAFWAVLEAHADDKQHVADLWTTAMLEAILAILQDMEPRDAGGFVAAFNAALEGTGFTLVHRGEVMH